MKVEKHTRSLHGHIATHPTIVAIFIPISWEEKNGFLKFDIETALKQRNEREKQILLEIFGNWEMVFFLKKKI